MKLTSRLIQHFSNGTQKYAFMFGPPGVEKGTFAKLLAKDLAYNHISTGEEIRKIVKGTTNSGFDSKLIGNISKAVKGGCLLNDEIVVQLIKAKVNAPQSEKGVIIEGFPRTQGQLEKYLRLFPVYGVLNLTLRQDILLQKLKGSRTCSNCGTVYSVCNIHRDGYQIDAVLPKKQGVCDNCKHEIHFKEEANQTEIRNRLQEYKIQTQSLLYLFQKMGVLMNCEVKTGLKEYPTIKKLLETKIVWK